MPAGQHRQQDNQVHARRVAYHEAGDAVVGWRHGFRTEEADMTMTEVVLEYSTTDAMAYGFASPVAPGRTELVAQPLERELRGSLLHEAEGRAQHLPTGNLAVHSRYPHVSTTPALVEHLGSPDPAQ
jgi:hypothetical protein